MWRVLVAAMVLTLAACGSHKADYVITNSPDQAELSQAEEAPTVDELSATDRARVQQYFNPSAPPAELYGAPFGCNPNYSGCVPIASDVDCEGRGDGPAFASGVRVTGRDVYRLDPDGDNRAC